MTQVIRPVDARDRQLGHRRYVPPEEQFEGGPQFIYETARAAYRAAARRHHPDYGGDPAVMARLNAAWDYIERRWSR